MVPPDELRTFAEIVNSASAEGSTAGVAFAVGVWLATGVFVGRVVPEVAPHPLSVMAMQTVKAQTAVVRASAGYPKLARASRIPTVTSPIAGDYSRDAPGAALTTKVLG